MTAAVDLASRWLGASVMSASDESFGDKEDLLKPSPAAFEPGHYGNRGEIVDGWETRRRREGGHDWAIIRLGAAGIITSVDIDTSFFTGNHPQSASVEACGHEGYPSPAEVGGPSAGWETIVANVAITGDSHNLFEVTDRRRFTHVRLSAYPDGGIARLRVYGDVVPDPRGLEELTVDLASQEYGGAVVASSDDFYSSASMLNRPDRARTMGEGWETQRRRDAGHDFAVFRLAFAGCLRRVIIDTAHFKYNASAAFALYGCAAEVPPEEDSPAWLPLVNRARLQPDTRHVYDIAKAGPLTLVRLDAFPDGGLSRVRLIGAVDQDARRAAGYRWFNALPARQATRCLTDAGIPAEAAATVAGQRPLSEHWLSEQVNSAEGADIAILAGLLEGRRL
ncbi:MAG TPA: allantoicase [Streptosporangiaceae bacterium]|nr:allantoicase [Streptosporangiaceae bacterium]